MTERERTTMVPFPSDAIIPERDLGTRPVLDARHLGVEFGGLKAVDDFNMIIGRTEIAGLIGPNGAGKTTIFNLITKVYQPTTGTILIDGKDTAGMNTIQVNKAGIARTFQNIRLFNKMSVEDNVKIGLHNRMRYGMGTGILRLPNYWKKEKLMHEKALELLSIFDMQDLADTTAGSLPYGAQRRLEIVRALATNPSLLLLDEPLSNLDARLRLEMREEIRRIQLQTQVTTIFVTHDQEEAMSISDHIVLMKDGVMQQFDQPQVLYDDPANQFVADFLGNPPINNIPGTVRGGVFTTEDGKASVALPMLEKVPDGAKVNLSVRSESFTVQPDGAPGTLQCQVTGVFKTGKEEMAAFLFGDVPFRAYIDLEEGLQKGQTVSLGLKKRGAFVFDRETGRRYV